MAIPLHKQILSSSAVSEGAWEDVGAIAVPFSIGVYGLSGLDRAQIYVSNKLTQPALAPPAAGDATMKLGGDISGDVMQIVDFAVKWVRVRKSAADAAPAVTKAEIFGYGAFVF